MALTEFGVNHALANKLYSKKLALEILKETDIADLISEGSDSVGQILTETQKAAGDQITWGLEMQLSGTGIQGDGILEGNEEELTYYDDAVLINQLRHAVRSKGKMSEQRVPYPVRERAKNRLRDWWTDRFGVSIFNQLCGYTVQSDTRFTGNNTVTAPDSTHHIWGGDATSDATIDAADTISLRDIDRLVEKAKTITPTVRPIMMNGRKKYVLFIHPYQEFNLRQSAASAGSWFDIQKAALQGGDKTGNPLYRDALGEYRDVILRVDTRVTQGVSATTTAISTVRRAVFCGAQSFCIAFGQDGGANKFSWVEELENSSIMQECMVANFVNSEEAAPVNEFTKAVYWR